MMFAGFDLYDLHDIDHFSRKDMDDLQDLDLLWIIFGDTLASGRGSASRR